MLHTEQITLKTLTMHNLHVRTYLGLESLQQVLSSLEHHRRFSSDHDGEAAVLGLAHLNVTPGPVHDLTNYVQLSALTAAKGRLVKVVLTLLYRNMEYLVCVYVCVCVCNYTCVCMGE